MKNEFYRAAIGAFIVNKNNQLLIVLKHGYGDKWDFPKGGIRVGENEIETLARELKEELGVTKCRVIGKSMISTIFRMPTNTDEEYVGQAQGFYWVRLDDENKISLPSNEVEKVEWINIDSNTVHKYLNQYDTEKVLQTLIPYEWSSIKQSIP